MLPIKTLAGPDMPDQYENFRALGQGGMGDIYIAFDKGQGVDVAVKVMKNDGRIEDLLASEFAIARSLDHPNIVSTYHSGDFSVNNENYFYASMEYVDGGDLSSHLKSASGPMPLEDAIVIMLQLCDGLREAHKQIVHRDLKPQNILFTKSGIAKICDFGISKFVAESTRTYTWKGYGTFAYMSPECWLSDTNTPAMDVYSLGLIFFEMLTGKRAFNAARPQDFQRLHLLEPMPDIDAYRSDIPVKIKQIINKMVEKRPQDRYANGDEVFSALSQINTSATENLSSNNNILAKAHRRINQLTADQLRVESEKQLATQQNDIRDYGIAQLFDRIERIISSINGNLELQKIGVTRSSRNLSASFIDKKMVVAFFAESSIGRFESGRRERDRAVQMEHFGGIMSPYRDSNVTKDGVDLVGYIEIQGASHNRRSFGANILLSKSDPADIYGSWMCCWFDDSGFSGTTESHYAIKNDDFFPEYEFGRDRVMHVRRMTFGELTNEVLESIIEHLVE